MNVVAYALLTYAMTAVISFGIVGVIVMIDKMFSSSGEEDNHD